MKSKRAHPISWSQVSSFRLNRHHLTQPQSSDVAAICRDVCGVQAQVMGSAHLALWARASSLVRQDVDSALWGRRCLVKTSAMRQTMHLLPSDEYHIYKTALRRSRMCALMRVMARLGVTQKEVNAMNAALLKILGNDPVPQLQLAAEIKPRVSRKLYSWMKLSWSIFRPAMIEGLVCFGPQRGSQATLVRVDGWLPPLPEISEQDAQRILLRRYLRAYGPAAIGDFCKWSGISVREAMSVWDSLGDDLDEVCIEGNRAFVLREYVYELETAKPTATLVRLLPSFDPYMLAHADKDHLVDPRYYKRVYRNQGWLSPVILLDGRVVGIWSYDRQRPRFQSELFQKLPRRILDEIDTEAQRLARFVESDN